MPGPVLITACINTPSIAQGEALLQEAAGALQMGARERAMYLRQKRGKASGDAAITEEEEATIAGNNVAALRSWIRQVFCTLTPTGNLEVPPKGSMFVADNTGSSLLVFCNMPPRVFSIHREGTQQLCLPCAADTRGAVPDAGLPGAQRGRILQLHGPAGALGGGAGGLPGHAAELAPAHAHPPRCHPACPQLPTAAQVGSPPKWL